MFSLRRVSRGGIEDYRASHLHKGSAYDALLREDQFDAHLADREREWLDAMIDTVFPFGINRYLDFACGTGRITEQISRHARETVGVDVSESMIMTARRRCPAVTFLVADITRESHRLGEFDLVSAFRFFGNAQQELRVSALAALNHLLIPGGHLVLNNHCNPLSPIALARLCLGANQRLDLSHLRLRRMLTQAGFSVVFSRGIDAWPVVRRRVAPWSVGSSAGERRDQPALGSRLFVPFCMDTIVVAEKVRAVKR